MADPDNPPPSLEDIIRDYLEAVAAGETPDREQLLARYPGCAAELAAFFADHDAMQHWARPFKAIDSEPPPNALADGETTLGQVPNALGPLPGAKVHYFGDYELLAEIARGGMGVVYKARQMKLNRLVALKMIRAGLMATEEEVKRFYTEAEAAANLDHPGIVPIYEVGRHMGQHYFSMGYVEGQSLAAKVALDPLPPRKAAELIATVTEAVHYAHQKGVIHRDLKPSNILLDREGHPRVTDFGLAKRVTGESDLTATGQVLGTPSYMPPEQASGRLDQIGPATDIYALGAVLYMLLIGRPPFQAADPLDTLRQVREQEPVAPQRLNAGVPRDLETIALKCLEKEPTRRYATAAALGDDLRRYLKGEPIQARPIGHLARLWRWCRRNRLLASALAAAAICLLLALGATSAGYLTTRLALTRVESARAKADQERVRAEREKEKAKANFQMARDAVKKYYTRVANDPRLKPHNLEKLRRDLLESANEFYEKLIHQEADNPDLQHERVTAFLARGSIEIALGNWTDAETAFNQAIAAAARLTQNYGTEPKYQDTLAWSHFDLGNLYKNTGQANKAEAAFKEAIAIRKNLAEKYPKVHQNQNELASSYNNLGLIYQTKGRTEEAEAAYKEALAIRKNLAEKYPELLQYQNSLASSHNNLGFLFQAIGRIQEAEAAFKEALAIRKILAEKHPEMPEYQYNLAGSHMNLGNIYQDTNRIKETEAAFKEALTIFQILVEKHPEVYEYQVNLAGSHNNLGTLYKNTDQLKEAEAAYKEALAIQKILAKKHPEVPECQNDLAGSHYNLGNLYQTTGRYAEAEVAYKEALAIQKILIGKNPEVPEYQYTLAGSLNSLGNLYQTTGQSAEAEATFKEGLAICKILTKKYPQVPEYQNGLATCYNDLGNLYQAVGQAHEAEAAFREAHTLWKNLAEKYPDVPEYQHLPPTKKSPDRPSQGKE